MNENIRVPEVRVIGEDGQMIGVMSPKEAIELARSKQQDLIEQSLDRLEKYFANR